MYVYLCICMYMYLCMHVCIYQNQKIKSNIFYSHKTVTLMNIIFSFSFILLLYPNEKNNDRNKQWNIEPNKYIWTQKGDQKGQRSRYVGPLMYRFQFDFG